MQDLARIPEFEGVWKSILFNPTSLSPTFRDVYQLLQVPSRRRFLASRLTPEMETYLKYMLQHVPMGNQKRYQQWFQQWFLAGPEADSLVCDLVRYICCVVHPTNEILQSDVIPRWAMIGWLMQLTKVRSVMC